MCMNKQHVNSPIHKLNEINECSNKSRKSVMVLICSLIIFTIMMLLSAFTEIWPLKIMSAIIIIPVTIELFILYKNLQKMIHLCIQFTHHYDHDFLDHWEEKQENKDSN